MDYLLENFCLLVTYYIITLHIKIYRFAVMNIKKILVNTFYINKFYNIYNIRIKMM